MKTTVFISHSSRDRSDDDGTPTQASGVRGKVYDRLKDDYEVFVDVNMRPGTEWRDEVADRLGHCDVAVFLIDEHALKSRYVQIEANTLTMLRRMASNSYIVVVLFDDIKSSQLKPAGFEELGNFHFIRPDSDSVLTRAEEIDWYVGEIIGVFAQLPKVDPDDPRRRWLRLIESCLHEVTRSVLAAGAVALGLDDKARRQVLAPVGGKRSLAWHLLECGGTESLVNAVDELRHGLRKDQLDKLVSYLMPTWVDTIEARRVLPPATRRESFRIELNAVEAAIGMHYLAGATCFDWGTYRHEVVGVLPGENAEDDLVDGMRERLGQLVRGVPEPLPPDYRPHSKAVYFLIVTTKDIRIGVARRAVKRVQRQSPWLIVFLLRGKRPGDPECDFVELTPLRDDEEDIALEFSQGLKYIKDKSA